MTRSTSAVSLAAVLLSGCIVSGGNPRPLYPNPEQPRPPGEVARLFGPIGEVDGQDVSRMGKSFALLPGCHIVKLAEKTGEINTLSSGGYVATLPRLTYAFRMRPAYTYEIQVQAEVGSGPTGQITIRAWERGEGGGATQLNPAASSADIEECQRWRP
jgi:hypothetical protein